MTIAFTSAKRVATVFVKIACSSAKYVKIIFARIASWSVTAVIWSVRTVS